ncbi:MAG: SpoIIE family protein phosphatase [Kofleriaceae bacterium]
MDGLRWTWLAAPYVLCSIAFTAVAIATALTRGDRVIRLGMVGAVVTALPWSLCQALAAMAISPDAARHLLKLGNGPVALIGPNLLLLLLAVGGQLERFRWMARISGVIGAIFVMLAWTTDWIVPDVQLTSSGLYYMAPGPLTGVHLTQLVVWLVIGIWIIRRSTPRADQRRTLRLLLGILLLGAVSSVDTLLLYNIWGSYPIAWLPALLAAIVALYLVLRTDLLRPQGLDRSMAVELGTFVGAGAATILLALFFVDSPVLMAITAASAWGGLSGLAWGITRARPAPIAEQRALDQFVAKVAGLDDAAKIDERLGALWKRTIGLELLETKQTFDPALATYFATNPEPIAQVALPTTRLGPARKPLEALQAELVVPLVDREQVQAIALARAGRALRDAERGLVIESARAAARAYTYVGLARTAAQEKETAREVEVADALRLQASASREAELGQWAVAAEYRAAARTTGAGWSAVELEDGRLALLVTEAQAHGVAAALATAALTGAFAAATAPGSRPVTLDELVATMRASSEGVIRGGEPVAAFLAILDAKTLSIAWACAGHPGALLVGPVAPLDTPMPEGSRKDVRARAVALGGEASPGASLTVATRGTNPLPVDSLLVVASSAVRGTDDERWRELVRMKAQVSNRLAATLVEQVPDAGEDLLAVVVRAR